MPSRTVWENPMAIFCINSVWHQPVRKNMPIWIVISGWWTMGIFTFGIKTFPIWIPQTNLLGNTWCWRMSNRCLPRITCFTGPGIIRPSNIIILMMEIHFGGGDGWIHRKTLLEMERRKMFRNRLWYWEMRRILRIVPNTKELWVMEACYIYGGIKLLGKLAMVERCLVSQLLR